MKNSFTNLKSFMWLDIITIKPYFRLKLLLVYTLMPMMLSLITGIILSGIGVGLLMGAMLFNYFFIVGEKCNIDALYATLSIDRKTVVAGRYLSMLVINCCAILLCLAFATIGWFMLNNTGIESAAAGSIWSTPVIFAMLIFIQVICVPLYFRFGYTKAKYLTMLPTVPMMIGFVLFYLFSGDVTFFDNNMITLTLFTVVLLVVVIFISYKLSISFYKKREF